MSRKEATRELKILKENYWDDDGYGHETKQYDDTMLALDMAIQALSQECVGSTQKHVENTLGMRCDDAISRQAVLKIIDGWYEQNRDTENIEDLIVLITYMDSVRPQQPCGDLIRRRAVLETLDDMDNVLDEDRTIENYKELLKECYEVLPSVNPQEPKTGYWIEVTNGRGGHECSLCHEYAPSYQNGDEWLTKYCPNCGVRMVEP